MGSQYHITSSSIDTMYIPLIEQALGVKLYEDQIKYLTGLDPSPEYYLRGTGRTTAYCIRLAFSFDQTVDLRRPELFSDALLSGLTGEEARRYSKDHFVHQFMSIREKLSNYGFPVIEVRY